VILREFGSYGIVALFPFLRNTPVLIVDWEKKTGMAFVLFAPGFPPQGETCGDVAHSKTFPEKRRDVG